MAVEAILNDVVIAHSTSTKVVEGNHYFPREDVDMSMLEKSDTRTFCSWKGEARYYSLDCDGTLAKDAAWTYPDPKPDAAHVKDHIAFWGDVEISED
ncbi:DUF427 domain-containing protein [Paraurantiacibacter namhicola]|uniref:DUF427 domain-containing protein n=1 Tax=Paraurantiacibacter namhicola TaxID=645517 RepID=A0A1C7D725_9SPHN|nr:DUF427 domain-containing protein [Paraurantiacibacter namhicola]ANU07280.1 hypothetical protein A6F65_00970 [Paraurantiacibacter namhicola]